MDIHYMAFDPIRLYSNLFDPIGSIFHWDAYLESHRSLAKPDSRTVHLPTDPLGLAGSLAWL